VEDGWPANTKLWRCGDPPTSQFQVLLSMVPFAVADIRARMLVRKAASSCPRLIQDGAVVCDAQVFHLVPVVVLAPVLVLGQVGSVETLCEKSLRRFAARWSSRAIFPFSFIPVVEMLQFPRQTALHLGALEDFLAGVDRINQFSGRERGKHLDAAVDADRLRFALRRISDFSVPHNADVRFSDFAAERDGAQPSLSLPFANALVPIESKSRIPPLCASKPVAQLRIAVRTD
jgi:hypothetical protein